MISKAESVCSDTNATATRGKPKLGDYNVLSRQNIPMSGKNGQLVKTSFPYRLIGNLSSIDVQKRQFGVLVKLEKCDPETLICSIHDYYAKINSDNEDEAEGSDKDDDEADEEEVDNDGEESVKAVKADERKLNSRTCKSVIPSEIFVGHVYAAYIKELKKYVRIRVVEKNHTYTLPSSAQLQLKVHLLDHGMVTTIPHVELIKLDKCFTEGEYQTALALACQLPTGPAPLPHLENFKLGDYIEVYVLSDEEPCLAVFGSLVSGPNSIPRELFAYGINPKNFASFSAANGKLPAETVMYKGWASNDLMRLPSWNLVTIALCEDPANIAFRDVFTSLRFLRLYQHINRTYKRDEFKKAMVVDAEKLYSGAPVIALYRPCNAYIRGTVTSVLHNGYGCYVEALDIPNFTLLNVPISDVYYPSSVLLNVPPQIFYVSLMKGYDSTLESCDILEEHLDLNSVATLKFSLEDNCAQLVNGENISVSDAINDYLLSLEEDAESDKDEGSHCGDIGGNTIDNLFDDDGQNGDDESSTPGHTDTVA